MSTELSPEEVEILKEHFRDADCDVVDLGETNFEIIGREMPLRSHVLVNPFYIELTTMIVAFGRGFLRNRRSRIHAFLCDVNAKSKFAKFTLAEDRPDKESGGWRIIMSAKLVTGSLGGNYEKGAINCLHMLWAQDIAELLVRNGDDSAFSLRAMLYARE